MAVEERPDRLVVRDKASRNRDALHRYPVHLPADRRHRSIADEDAAHIFGKHASWSRTVQPDLHVAWDHDDVSLRGAGDGGHGNLSGPLNDRNAERGLSKAQ